MPIPQRKLGELRKNVESGVEILIRSAIRELERAPAFRDDPEAFELLGIGYASLGKFEEAAARFYLAFKATGVLHFLCRYGGVLLFIEAQRAEGEELLRRLVAEHKADVAAYVELAEHYIARERFEDAERIIDLAIAVKEFVAWSGPLYVLKSLVLAAMGDEPRAQAFAVQAAEQLLGREIASMSRIPASLADEIARIKLLNQWFREGYAKLLRYWLSEAEASPPPSDAEQLSELQALYDRALKPEIDAHQHTQATLDATLELWAEMEPSRAQASRQVL